MRAACRKSPLPTDPPGAHVVQCPRLYGKIAVAWGVIVAGLLSGAATAAALERYNVRYCRPDRLSCGTPADALGAAGEAINETLRHRCPDDSGVWAEAESGVVLAQRRLAIIDLSPGGAQPMHSADRRYVITFNGEIYNYRDIRNKLAAAGRTMRSDSDTEVLLEACALWGVERAIERTIGMFAFALWDRTARTLTLARDRLAKPLYYAASPDRLLFASQLKAFRALPDW